MYESRSVFNRFVCHRFIYFFVCQRTWKGGSETSVMGVMKGVGGPESESRGLHLINFSTRKGME